MEWNDWKGGVGGDGCSLHIVLIHGLILNGKLDEAYRFMEMKEKVKTVTAWTKDRWGLMLKFLLMYKIWQLSLLGIEKEG